MISALADIAVEGRPPVPSSLETRILKLLEIDDPGFEAVRHLGWRGNIEVEDNNRYVVLHDRAALDDDGIKNVLDIMVWVDIEKVVSVVSDESPNCGVIFDGVANGAGDYEVARIRALEGESGDCDGEMGCFRSH